MSVLVFADSPDGKLHKTAFEATNYAKRVADLTGGTVTAVVTGECSNISELGKYGAGKVLHAKNVSTTDTSVLGRVVTSAAEKENSSIIIFSHDLEGKAVAPGVAARLNAGYVPGAIEVPSLDGGFHVKKSVFSGKAFAFYDIKSDKKVVSVLPNSYQLEEMSAAGTVEEFSPSDLPQERVVVKEKKTKEGEISLPEAELVVSAGRGLKGPENWGMVEELADVLGAATACSRPVADSDWRPHHEHVGQTGVAIAPNLYIAIGISGAIQHLAGVNRSKVIVVINKDAEAPFFKAADYGIVGDAFEVVPKLTEALKKFKQSN